MINWKLPALCAALALCVTGGVAARPNKPKPKPKKFTIVLGKITNIASCTVNAEGTVDATLTVQHHKSTTTQVLTLNDARVETDDSCPTDLDGCELLDLAAEFGVNVNAKIDNSTGQVFRVSVGDEVELEDALLTAVDCTAGEESITVTAANGTVYEVSIADLDNAEDLCEYLDSLPAGTTVEVEFELCSVVVDQNGNILVQAEKVEVEDADDDDDDNGGSRGNHGNHGNHRGRGNRGR